MANLEMSEDISPILDTKIKFSKDLAYPILTSAIDNIFNSITSYQNRKSNHLLQKWKQATVHNSIIQEKQISNHMFLLTIRLSQLIRFLTGFYKKIESKAFDKMKNQMKIGRFLLETQEKQRKVAEKQKIVSGKQAQVEKEKKNIRELQAELRKIEENLEKNDKAEKEMFGRLKGVRCEDDVVREIRRLTGENSDLQDSLVSYELEFEKYIKETEKLIRNLQPGLTKTRIF
ncbi:hypothetical protein SteCoe_22140 [Stentor coeruleus]|uniref:Uncharacterized protein n=1 Tax=Stentor coeruleus TaxID=5963 RepID=A0A1R2BMX7_9CILI|nr:hypothetical protein SteCoe_22140 [Stentor coeruleus]